MEENPFNNLTQEDIDYVNYMNSSTPNSQYIQSMTNSEVEKNHNTTEATYDFSKPNYNEDSNGETSMLNSKTNENVEETSYSYSYLTSQLFNQSTQESLMNHLDSSCSSQYSRPNFHSSYSAPAGVSFNGISTDPGKSIPTLGNFPGLYSNSGFDVLSILAKVANRPDPQIHLGPVDMSCSFVVVDACRSDLPLVYASKSFENLTGYSDVEVIGRNCRFLQSPDGQVTSGSRRRYTDNSSVHNLKKHIFQRKEIQISLVNYKKGGQPFMNLLTIIPIAFGNGDDVTHFIGFQVNLIEQPNSILQKMQNGTYMMGSSSLCSGVFQKPSADHMLSSTESSDFSATSEVYEIMEVDEQSNQEETLKNWNQMLLEHSDDFIHVLSLKGIFLYCSYSCKKLLGYKAEELIGQNISMLCEPTDLALFMRELRESMNMSENSEPFNYVYRIKNRYSGYFWFEVQGKLYTDHGRVRKCVVLTGRPRPVYRLSMEAIQLCGGLSNHEFWSKLTLDGMYLYATRNSKQILDFTPDELIGTSLYQTTRFDRATVLTKTLQQVADGTTVKLRHKMINKNGHSIAIVSTFYPGDATQGKPATFILCQSKEVSEDDECLDDRSVTSSVPSPQTNQKSIGADNLFQNLEPDGNTTWQYELHRLRILNQHLRDELQSLTEKREKELG